MSLMMSYSKYYEAFHCLCLYFYVRELHFVCCFSPTQLGIFVYYLRLNYYIRGVLFVFIQNVVCDHVKRNRKKLHDVRFSTRRQMIGIRTKKFKHRRGRMKGNVLKCVFF